MSHAAINNLLDEVNDVFTEAGDVGLLRAGRQNTSRVTHPWVRAASNSVCARPEFNLVAGTTWMFSSTEMRESPVDVLLVDEAGQLSLADTLAASTTAHNIVLLGDPQQLAQVAQAKHPNGSGRSALEHVLAGEATMPADRGVFLSQTWRMHPVAGTGLRWVRAEHQGRTTYAPEEAELIRRDRAADRHRMDNFRR